MIRWIKKIGLAVWREFVYGGHLLSLGASSVVYAGSVSVGIEITWVGLLAAYLAAEAVYLFDRARDAKADSNENPGRARHLGRYAKIFPSLVGVYGFSWLLLVVIFGNYIALIIGLVVLSLGLLYGLVFKGLTKKIVGFKSFFVGLEWAALLVFIAALQSYSIWSVGLWLMFVFVFIREFVPASFFDVKDQENDCKKGLRTIVVVVGERAFRFWMLILSILASIPIVVGIYMGVINPAAMVLLFTIPHTLVYLYFDRKLGWSDSFLYGVYIEGEPLLWGPLVYVAGIVL